MKLSNVVQKLLQTIKSNSPEILAGAAVAGVFTTSYLTAKATRTVTLQLRDEGTEDLPIKEKVKIYWKPYVPAVVSGVATVGCIIGCTKASGRQTATAMAAYTITEKAFTEYKEKVVEQVGKGKEQKIRDEIAQDKVKATSLGAKEVIVLGGGNVLCCELYTGRYFRSDVESIRRAANAIGERINNNYFVTLNEFYDLIGLAYTSESGRMGWNSDRMLALEFSTTLSENEEPCIAFDYNYLKPIM